MKNDMLTREIMKRMWPRAKPEIIDGVVTAAPSVFEKYGINNPRRVAHFMAQISHECGGGTIVRESGAYSASRIGEIFGPGKHSAKVGRAEAMLLAKNGPKLFERVYGLGNPQKARELGNTEPGDGWKYRGGGFIQTTGRDAYERASVVAGVDLVEDPDKIADGRYALAVAADEFGKPRIMTMADLDDLRGVTRAINGGYNGLADREAWLKRWRSALNAAPAPRSAANDPLGYGATGWDVEALQRRLKELGYLPGDIDGDFGPATRRAVVSFQADHDLRATGVIDGDTKAALATSTGIVHDESRAGMTVEDLRERGSSTVAAADGQRTVAAVAAGGSALVGTEKSGLLDMVKNATDQFGEVRALLEPVQDALQWAANHWWLAALVGAGVVWRYGGDVILSRLKDARSGVNMGR